MAIEIEAIRIISTVMTMKVTNPLWIVSQMAMAIAETIRAAMPKTTDTPKIVHLLP